MTEPPVPPEPPEAAAESIRVSTLELFFDLVFVFVITQLTDLLVDDLSLRTLGDVVLVLGVVWWMYSGYAWLTNAVAPSSTTRRTLLLTGMAGFLVLALAIPDAYGAKGWLFGVSYVVITLVHTGLFFQGGPAAVQAMKRLAPLNGLSALLVLAGGLAPDPYRHLCWAAAVALQIATPYLHPIGMHGIVAGHFVERHGLVVIIAIGESIVEVGAGFAGVDLDLATVLVAVLGLCVAYYLWWLYFARDDERSEQVLAGLTDPLRRARLALNGWGYAHYPMLLGIVVLSAGIKESVGHPFEGAPWGPALALGGGTALYLFGHAAFLRLLGLSGWPHRTAAGVLVLATVPLGHLLTIAQLAAVPLIMAAAAIIEDVPVARRKGSTAISDFGRTAD